VKARRLVFVSVGSADDLIEQIEDFLHWAKEYGPERCLYKEFAALGCHMEVFELADET